MVSSPQSLHMVSFRLYATGSIIAASGVVAKYYLQHGQYYTTLAALAQSKAAGLVRHQVPLP